jgi:hypothetical protein
MKTILRILRRLSSLCIIGPVTNEKTSGALDDFKGSTKKSEKPGD